MTLLCLCKNLPFPDSSDRQAGHFSKKYVLHGFVDKKFRTLPKVYRVCSFWHEIENGKKVSCNTNKITKIYNNVDDTSLNPWFLRVKYSMQYAYLWLHKDVCINSSHTEMKQDNGGETTVFLKILSTCAKKILPLSFRRWWF